MGRRGFLKRAPGAGVGVLSGRLTVNPGCGGKLHVPASPMRAPAALGFGLKRT